MRVCIICAVEREPTRVELIRWRDGDPTFTSGDRCIDRLACRKRVEDAGEAWVVDDPAPRTRTTTWNTATPLR